MLLFLLWQWVDPGVAHSSATNWAPVVAATVESPIPDQSAWAQYGPAGLSAGIFASIAWVLFQMQRETLRIERERSTRYEQEIRDLNKQFRDQVIPLLTKFTESASTLIQVTTEATQTMNRQARDR